MPRESDKHGPRLDDEMRRESDAFTTGAPVDSRAEENMEKEGPLDYDDRPNDVAELRQDLARHVEGAIFPARKSDIIADAERMNAPPHVIREFRRLPDATYDGFPQIWNALGYPMHEPGRRA